MKKIIVSLIVAICTIACYTCVAWAAEPVYTEDEITLIARVVYAEARGESFEGRCAVAEVVFARFESGKFGTSLAKITRKGQFCKASAKIAKKNGAVFQECREAVIYAITTRTLPANAYYFQKANRKYWGGRKTIIRYTTIGKHTFYTAGEPLAVPVFEEAQG